MDGLHPNNEQGQGVVKAAIFDANIFYAFTISYIVEPGG